MHKSVLVGSALVLSLSASAAVCGQSPGETEPPGPATKLEKFLSRKNLLVIKETHFIGAVPGLQGSEVRLEAVALSAPTERERAYGVRLARTVTQKEAGEQAGIIDFDELDSFRGALDQMLRVASEAKLPDESPQGAILPSVELAFTTRGGVKAALVQSGRQFTGQLQVSRATEDGEISFGVGALGRLRSLIAQARDKLVGLGAK
jgi:hypothetical protein